MRFLMGCCLFLLQGGWVAAGPVEAKAELVALMEAEWQFMLDQDPIFASSAGVKKADSLWPDVSLAAKARFQERHLAILDRLLKLNLDALSPQDRLNARLLRYKVESETREYAFRWFLAPINQREGVQTADVYARQLNLQTEADYLSWLKRLEALPVYIDQHIELMRQGVAERMVLPRGIMSRITAQIETQLVTDATKSGFYYPFTVMPANIPNAEALKQRGQALILSGVVPAYRKFHEFYVKEYLPGSFEKVGIWQVPRGKELYAHFAESHTTTTYTPEQIHQIGLDEVARIRAEMEKIIKQVGFKGDFKAFLQYLRTDPQFYHKTPAALLTAYRDLAKRIDPTLVKAFDKMPRMPYGVEPIPDSFAPDTTTAYYQPANPDGSVAGTFFVNLYQPETRPIYEMEALAIHEAVPGHHFQIAMAYELGELPEFRRYHRYTVYTEGWALYAESLGEELGFYRDPYSKFGQLTYEMWRAIRLVVDTGVHQLGWDRQKAIDYFSANAAKSEQDIINEVDRYIVWPGQALGYKMGELKIQELRKRAESKLGAAFNLKYFHNKILCDGSLPLTLLEEQVDAWIAAGGPRE